MKTKKALALILAGALTFGLTVSAFAADSPTAKSTASSSSASQTVAQAAAAEGKTVEEYANNAVISVPDFPEQLPTAQGGGIVIDGTVTNERFELTKPTKTDVALGKQLAESLNGLKFLSVVGTKGTRKDFNSAIVNFYVKGIKEGTSIVCYELVDNKWVLVPVLQVYKDHVIVNMAKHGKLMFYEVPAELAELANSVFAKDALEKVAAEEEKPQVSATEIEKPVKADKTAEAPKAADAAKAADSEAKADAAKADVPAADSLNAAVATNEAVQSN